MISLWYTNIISYGFRILTSVLKMNIDITVEDILKGQGADPQVIASKRPGLIKVAVTALEMGNTLIKPRVFMRIFSREVISGCGLLPRALIDTNLAALDERLPKAISYVLAVCTIGCELEKLSSRLMSTDCSLALALDGMANAAIDRFVERKFQEIAKEAGSEGMGASLPFSPGSREWPLEIGQPFIFELLRPDPEVVQLNESHLMLPRKSSSFVMGVGPELERHGKTCDFCGMSENCRYRIRKKF